MRVGDVRPRHADHVELARGDRVPGGGDVGDAGGMEHRQAGGRAHLAREVEVRGRGHAHDRDDVEQRVVAVDVAADDVDEVDEAGGGQAAADLEALLALQADVPALVAGHADADQESVADRPAHRLEHAQAEAHPVLEAAAPLVVALVGRRRPELVGQVAVGVDLAAVEPGRLHARGGRRVVGDDALDVPLLDRLGEAAVRGSRIGEGASTGSQSALFQAVRRPRWVSWIITAAPCSWHSSASFLIQGTISSL